MSSVLLVSASQKGEDSLRGWLGPSCACDACRTAAQARALLSKNAYDMLIVNAPLSDEDGETLCAKRGAGTLLLTPEAQYEAVRARMEPKGVLTLPKPLTPAMFDQAVSLLRAARVQVERLEAKLTEVRVVERAKWVLIGVLQMSEKQAHRYIEKQAMDLHITRREVAENILKTYEF